MLCLGKEAIRGEYSEHSIILSKAISYICCITSIQGDTSDIFRPQGTGLVLYILKVLKREKGKFATLGLADIVTGEV